MDWFLWLVLGHWVFNGLGSVWLIGKPRPVITPGAAVVLVIIYTAFIVGLLVTR